MRLLFANNFDGASTNTITQGSDIPNYGVAARIAWGTGFERNQMSVSGTLTLATGLRGTGKCWVATTHAVSKEFDSPDYPDPITCSCFSFDFKLATSVTSQVIYTASGSGTALALGTNAGGKLVATVNATPHTSVALTLVVGQVYNCEVLIKTGAASTGKFQVRIDGMIVPELQSSGITISVGTPNVIQDNTFDNAVANNLHVGAYIWRGGDDAFDESLFIGGGEEGKIGRVQDLLPVADGVYTSWTRVSGSFAGVGWPQGGFPFLGNPDTTYANDYQQVNESTFDGFLHYLMVIYGTAPDGDPPIPQSFVFDAFDEYEEGTIPNIIGVYQNFMGAGGSGDVGVPFLRINRTDYVDSKFQNIAVAPPAGNFQQWWLSANCDTQFGPVAIAYDENPDSGSAWTVADLQALEGGLSWVRWDTGLHKGNSQKTCSHAMLSVVWVEGEAPGSEDAEELGSECQPCDDASSARYLDSHLTYDGTNTTATTISAQAPGVDWDTVGLTYTLTSASGSAFLATDDDAPKKAFRLGTLDGDYVIFDVVTYTSGTSITATNRTAVPASLQATATTEWARMVSRVTGLGHLEGEEVYGNLDGIHYGPWTVASGIVNFTDEDAAVLHAAVATVGLLIVSEIQTLDFDIPGQGRSVAATSKTVVEAFIQGDKSRDFLLVSDPADENTHPPVEASFLNANDLPHVLVSRKQTFSIPTQWSNAGRVFIRHQKALPLNILSIEPKIDSAGKAR